MSRQYSEKIDDLQYLLVLKHVLSNINELIKNRAYCTSSEFIFRLAAHLHFCHFRSDNFFSIHDFLCIFHVSNCMSLQENPAHLAMYTPEINQDILPRCLFNRHNTDKNVTNIFSIHIKIHSRCK